MPSASYKSSNTLRQTMLFPQRSRTRCSDTASTLQESLPSKCPGSTYPLNCKPRRATCSQYPGLGNQDERPWTQGLQQVSLGSCAWSAIFREVRQLTPNIPSVPYQVFPLLRGHLGAFHERLLVDRLGWLIGPTFLFTMRPDDTCNADSIARERIDCSKPVCSS